MTLLLLAVVEPKTRVELKLPSEVRCIYLPEQSLPAGCELPNVDQLRATASRDGLWLVATDSDHTLMLTGEVLDQPNAATMTSHDIDRFIEGVAHRFVASGMLGPKPSTPISHVLVPLRLYPGSRVAEFSVTADTSEALKAGGYQRVAGALLPIDRHLFALMVLEKRPTTTIQDVLGELRLAPGASFSYPWFGGAEHDSYRAGERAGRACCCLMPVIALALVAWRLLKRKAQPLPPPT